MDILNIANIDYEETIKQVIKEVKEEYKDLTIFLSCKIFSSLVSKKLRERHVITRLISTKDLGCNYDHWFSLVKDKEDLAVKIYHEKINRKEFAKKRRRKILFI